MPLSFAQQRLWFMDQLEPGGYTYNMPGSFRLIGDLDVDAFKKSLETVVARHEVLRTHFPIVNGDPTQEISPPFELEIPVIDLMGLADVEKENESPAD